VWSEDFEFFQISVVAVSPISAKVVSVSKESHQYRVVVQIEHKEYLDSFHTLRSGEIRPFTGGYRNGRFDVFRCWQLRWLNARIKKCGFFK
jgi:hypothetical protein